MDGDATATSTTRMSALHELATFALDASSDDLGAAVRERLKAHVLDALGCALGALAAPSMKLVRAHVDGLGGSPGCSLIGGGSTALDRATLYNGALVRHLQFTDAFVAERDQCHPADNLAALLAAAELTGRSGDELLVALAVAYQIECRLTETLRLHRRGLDPTLPLALSVTAGLSRLFGLGVERTVDALAIAGADGLSLLATRAEPLSAWTAMAAPSTCVRAVHAVMLARRGLGGPRGLLDGRLGLEGWLRRRLRIDWQREKLDMIERIVLLRYDADPRAQSAIDAAIDLRRSLPADALEIDSVLVEVSRAAWDRLGGGALGDKDVVAFREQAMHNLRYLVAIALLDGEVGPRQIDDERLHAADVQDLFRRVTVKPRLRHGRREPALQPATVTARLRDGQSVERHRSEFEGFPTRPASWQRVVDKLEQQTAPDADPALRRHLVAAVASLEALEASELTRLLSGAQRATALAPSL